LAHPFFLQANIEKASTYHTEKKRTEIADREREPVLMIGKKLGFLYCSLVDREKVSDFPVPSRDVTNQTLPGRE
jgi:hypothetical protein